MDYIIWAIFMDDFEASDAINHKLVLEKLHTYGFNKDAPKAIHNYLNNRYQRKFLVPRVKSFWEYHKVLFLDYSF